MKGHYKIVTESSKSASIERRRHKSGEQLSKSILEALSEGKPCIEVKNKFGFPGKLYDAETYGQAAGYLALHGVNIEARRYKKKVPLSGRIMRRVLIYDVIDIAGGGEEPTIPDDEERGELVAVMYPPPAETEPTEPPEPPSA